MVSVALSVASLRLGVTQHPALWSPDFPPRLCRSGRPALLTYPSIRPWAAALTRLVHPHPGLPPSRGKALRRSASRRLASGFPPAAGIRTGQGGRPALLRVRSSAPCLRRNDTPRSTRLTMRGATPEQRAMFRGSCLRRLRSRMHDNLTLPHAMLRPTPALRSGTSLTLTLSPQGEGTRPPARE